MRGHCFIYTCEENQFTVLLVPRFLVLLLQPLLLPNAPELLYPCLTSGSSPESLRPHGCFHQMLRVFLGASSF